jgi:protein JSN1
MTTEEVDQVAADFLDGEIVDLASDWLGNTVSRVMFLYSEKLLNLML